jgi:class 3 adenylate cyclase
LEQGCSYCGATLVAGAKYCQNCARPVSAEHQARLEPYLPRELHTKLEAARAGRAMEGERRVVTMLFCDVKGSTAMAENLDPEEWAEIMNGAFEHLIAPVYRYEGTLARLMGDAIFAFFGAPIAHEDDPQRAVMAGMEIIDGIRTFREKVKADRDLDLNVRVGINTGPVMVGQVGSDLRLEYTAMGDAVNVARPYGADGRARHRADHR